MVAVEHDRNGHHAPQRGDVHLQLLGAGRRGTFGVVGREALRVVDHRQNSSLLLQRSLRAHTANERDPFPCAYPVLVTVATAQYVPRFLVRNVKLNDPFEAVLPDALAIIGPEQPPEATWTDVDAPPSGAALVASVAVEVIGTL